MKRNVRLGGDNLLSSRSFYMIQHRDADGTMRPRMKMQTGPNFIDSKARPAHPRRAGRAHTTLQGDALNDTRSSRLDRDARTTRTQRTNNNSSFDPNTWGWAERNTEHETTRSRSVRRGQEEGGGRRGVRRGAA